MKEVNGRAFAERFALNPGSYAWLLGAGASATSGIPTGFQMIQDFRARLFASESGISLREIDVADPVWQARIDRHHELQGKLPPRGDPSEYARAFEALHTSSEDRRLYIRNHVSKGQPSLGHKVLGSLLASRRTPCIFTTNFDTLIEDAATVAVQLLPPGDRSKVTLAAIDNAGRAETCLRDNDWPLVVKLHGDYQSVELKNTDEELKSQDGQLRLVLSHAMQRFGLVVAGYSGRDDSVMCALADVLRESVCYPKGIYWLCPDPTNVMPGVREFLHQAELAHVEVHLISGTTFDELLGDTADVAELPPVLVTHIFGDRKADEPAQVPLQRAAVLPAPVLRLTALPVVVMPTVARRINLTVSPGIADVRRQIRDSNVWAVVAQAGSPRSMAVFGNDAELLRALAPFQPTLAGEMSLEPAKESWAKGILYDSLVRALCRSLPLYARLNSRGNTIAVSRSRADLPPEELAERRSLLARLQNAYASPLNGKVPGTTGAYSEGLAVRLELADDRWWLVFEPTTFIDIQAAQDDDDRARAQAEWDTADEWRRERWAQKYNRAWSNILDAWVELLTRARGSRHSTYSLATADGIDATFELGIKSVRTRPAHDHDYFHHQQGTR